MLRSKPVLEKYKYNIEQISKLNQPGHAFILFYIPDNYNIVQGHLIQAKYKVFDHIHWTCRMDVNKTDRTQHLWDTFKIFPKCFA